MKNLGWPTFFCISLQIGAGGMLCGIRMRCPQSTLTTVRALQSIGYETVAAGDGYNDIDMLRASKAGFLFRSTEQIKADNPDVIAVESYAELMAEIKKVMGIK